VELRTEDTEPMAEILRLTDGMPLAILLAAAWADMLSITDIASEIAKSVDFLERESADAPDRHRSIRAVFDYTWALLTPDERTIFAALSVFRGGLTRNAAESVAGASLRDLAALANKSLVTPNPETGRYRVHELLRQFAEAELEADPEHCAEVLDAHAAYYGGFAARAFAEIHQGDQRLMLETIEGDIDNIRAAWRHALEAGDAHLARQILGAFWIVYEVRGWHQAAVPLLGEAIDGVDGSSSDIEVVAAHALALATRGWFLALVGQENEGARAAEEAIETLTLTSDVEALWLAYHCLGLCTAYQTDFKKLDSVATDGIAVARTLDGPFAEASVTNWRTLSAQMIETPDEAKRILEENEIYKDLGDQYIMAWHLMQRGRLARVEGRLDDSIDLYRRSVGFANDIGYARAIHVSTEGLGDATFAAGDLEAAEAAYLEVLGSAEQMSLIREMLSIVVKIAKTRGAKGDHAGAVMLVVVVLKENISDQQSLLAAAPIVEVAEETIANLEQEMGMDEFELARTAGKSMSYGEVVRDLTSRTREFPAAVSP
jgi:tetratricopeptide (TPR) repeat protein